MSHTDPLSSVNHIKNNVITTLLTAIGKPLQSACSAGTCVGSSSGSACTWWLSGRVINCWLVWGVTPPSPQDSCDRLHSEEPECRTCWESLRWIDVRSHKAKTFLDSLVCRCNTILSYWCHQCYIYNHMLIPSQVKNIYILCPEKISI